MSSIVENLNTMLAPYSSSRIPIQAVILVEQVTTKFAVKEFFSYELFHARKKKNRVPTRYLQEEHKIRRSRYLQEEHKIRQWVFFVLRVAQFRKAKDFFCRRATYKGKYGKAKEAVESVRAGLSPQKGDVRNSRKEKDQGRQEGGSSEGKVPRALHKEFLFFGSRVFGFRSGPARLKYWLLRFFSTRKPCAKEVPEKDYFTQQKQYLKSTTLCNYSAKAVP
jgi:hypothetical protein